MALRDAGPGAPSTTSPARFFTMVNMNQADNSTGRHQDHITDLVVASPSGGSSYLPGNPTSAYASHMIVARITGENHEASTWPNMAPLVNDAITNQSSFFNAIGSVAMSFNLSENMIALRGMIENSVLETSDRDPSLLSREIEMTICKAAFVSPTLDHFKTTMASTFQEIYASTQLLANIYTDLRFLVSDQNEGPSASDAVVDFEALANGTETMGTSPVQAVSMVDPMTTSQLVAKSITPGPIADTEQSSPRIILYEETSPQIKNAVLVNNLVIAGAMPAIDSTAARPGDGLGATTRSPGSDGGGLSGGY